MEQSPSQTEDTHHVLQAKEYGACLLPELNLAHPD